MTTPTTGQAASQEGRMTEEQLIDAMADAYNPAWANKIPGEPDEVYASYRTRIRRDMSRVLAVVREHIALELEAESECTPCSEDALVVRGCADLVRASGSYDRVDEIISARQHDGAALAEANASLALVSGNRDALAEDLVETQAALAEARERIAVLEAEAARLTRERDAFRAVLEGAEYRDLEGIAAYTPEQARQVGEYAARQTKLAMNPFAALTNRKDAADA